MKIYRIKREPARLDSPYEAIIVVARNKGLARQLLEKELGAIGFPQQVLRDDLLEIDMKNETVHIL